MSQSPHLLRGSFSSQDPSSVEKETSHASAASQHRDGSNDTYDRLSWRPSGPVEPPLEPTQVRSIGVHAILNPPPPTAITTTNSTNPGSHRDVLPDFQPSSAPHSRRSSVQSARIVHPHPLSQQHAALSPLNQPRRIITPVSPSARLASAAASSRNTPYPAAAKTFISQSPLTHEPQSASSGLYNPAHSSPLPVEPVLVSPASSAGAHLLQQGRVSLHSTPTFHAQNQRTSGPAATTNPSSQENSPSTPHSTFSPFGRFSPAIGSVSAPHPTPPFVGASPYATVDPSSSSSSARQHNHHHPTVPGGPRQDESSAIRAVPHQPDNNNNNNNNHPLPGMIPCFLDLKSGSSSQAEKRKANSDASRRFRNRKKQEQQMEQKIAAQQDEIKKQAETLQRQAEEIRALTKERDYYRSERDFYRENLARVVPPAQFSARPPSPRNLRLSLHTPVSEPGSEPAWHNAEGGATGNNTTVGSTPGGQQSVRSEITSSTANPSASSEGSWSATAQTQSPY